MHLKRGSSIHVQVRIMGNFGVNGGIPASLIPKVQLALFANKVWNLSITSFSSVLDSKKTLTPFGRN